jgi:repressor LexA
MSLSARQQHILQVIKDFSARGYAPRYEEIGAAVGIRSTNGVRHQLKALTIKGYLRPRPKGQHRCTALVEPLKAAA